MGGPKDAAWSHRLEPGGSALGLSGSPTLPPPLLCLLPTHLPIFSSSTFLLPCFRPHQSPVPSTLSCPHTLDLAVSVPAVRPRPDPLLLAACPHPCQRICKHPPGASERPCLIVYESKYLSMSHSASARCWMLGKQQTQSSPSLVGLKLQRRAKMNKGII